MDKIMFNSVNDVRNTIKNKLFQSIKTVHPQKTLDKLVIHIEFVENNAN